MENKSKYCINLDRLWFLVDGVIFPHDTLEVNSSYEFENGRIKFKLKFNGNKWYKYIWDCFIDGKEFATILTTPRSPEIMGYTTTKVEILNHALYEKGMIDKCQMLFQKMAWKVRNISQADIALDGHGFLESMDDFLSSKVEKVGRAKISLEIPSGRKVQGFYVGSKKSKRKLIRCYDKTAEIEQSSYKYYIKEVWTENNLIQDKNVERLELSLRNDEIKYIKEFDWTRLNEPEYLAGIMKMCFTNFYEFRELTKEGDNVSRAKKIEYIDWSAIKSEKVEKVSARKASDIRSMMFSSKRLALIHFQTGVDLYRSISRELATNCNALEWWYEKWEQWQDEWEFKSGRNSTGEIHYENCVLPHYKSYQLHEQMQIFPDEILYKESSVRV